MEPASPFFTRTELTELLAESYAQAVRQSADMHSATEILEAVHTCLRTESDPFRVWAELDAQVARSDQDRLRPIVFRLRDRFEQAALARARADLEIAFSRGADVGWKHWLNNYIRCFDLRGWRSSMCLALAESIQSQAPLPDFSPKQIAYFTRCIDEERWAETAEWFEFLARQAETTVLCARLLVIVGEIELVHFLRIELARERFQAAENLAPQDLRTFIGWSEFWLRKDLALSRKAAEEAIRVAPDIQDGYVALAECQQEQQDFSGAQESYQRGIRVDPGGWGSYRGLQRLWGRVELFAERRERVLALGKQIMSLHRDLEYATHIDQGDILRQNKLYAEAHSEFQRAAALNPSRHDAYCSDGYIWLDQIYEPNRDKTQDGELLARARECFKQAIDKAPEALGGYWGMSWLAEQEERWGEALEWCQESLLRRPQWETTIRNRMAGLNRKLGEFEKAEEELFAVIELEPGNDQAFVALSDLGEDYYLKAGRYEDAMRLFAEVRRRRGEKAEPGYQNRVGNLNYYRGDYAAAAAAYRKAIAAKPDEAVYHSNLALALELLKTPGKAGAEIKEALAELQTAAKLAPDDKGYKARMDALQLRLDFLANYGEEALQFSPVPTPIRVYIGDAWHGVLLTPDGQNLTAATQAAINSLRSSIREVYGFTLSSVRFADFTPPSPDYQYLLSLFDERVREEGTPASARASSSDHFSAFFNELGSLIRKNLHVLVTYQNAFNLLTDSGKCSPESEITPKTVLNVLYQWREHLKNGGTFADFDAGAAVLTDARVSTVFQHARVSPLNPEEASRSATVRLFISGSNHLSLDRLIELLPNTQETVFTSTGLIPPHVQLNTDNALAAGTCCLELNGKRLEVQTLPEHKNGPGATDPESELVGHVASVLGQHKTELLTETLTAFYLSLVESSYPRLAFDVRRTISKEGLTQALRAHLAAGETLNNFPEVLEAVLAQTVFNM